MTSASEQGRRAHHITLVDAGKDLRTLRGLLADAGFKVRAFTSTESAFDRALASPPRCSPWKLDFAATDGLELCRWIRKTAGLSQIPILLLSRRSHEAEVVAGLEAGADDYIIKHSVNGSCWLVLLPA